MSNTTTGVSNVTASLAAHHANNNGTTDSSFEKWTCSLGNGTTISTCALSTDRNATVIYATEATLFDNHNSSTINNITQLECRDGSTCIAEIIISIIIIVAIVFGVIGSILSIAVWSKKDMYTVNFTNFLISLSVADLLMLLCRLPVMVYNTCALMTSGISIEYEEFAWQVYYNYSLVIMELFFTISAWSLTAASFVRYLAFCHPFTAKRIITKQKSRVVLHVIWVLSALINLPVIFLSFDRSLATYQGNIVNIVVIVKGDDILNIYTQVKDVFTTFVPWFVLMYCIIRLSIVFKRQQHVARRLSIGATCRNIQIRQSREQNVLCLTLIGNSIVFCLIYFPIFLPSPTTSTLYTNITHMLGYLYSDTHFILYLVTNRRFRKTLFNICTLNKARDSRVRRPQSRHSTELTFGSKNSLDELAQSTTNISVISIKMLEDDFT
ncbi:unnamed protein product [Owenia fusiformis]|uniref:Uncharacterized protein n=1 Tax=Owenia fusiformis TaxID=6347 RepID=A0A8J1TKC0_OWEFU|nr:unnamed protein product [Owenia fusiformis]